MKFRLGWGKGFEILNFYFWGEEGLIFVCYLLSYFASISLHTYCHDPRTIPSGEKVCVVVGGGRVVGDLEGKFSVSFGF